MKRLRAATEGDTLTPEVEDFKTKLALLKLDPQLRSLCKANHLMISGSKLQLTERLVMCRMHGHAGPCPNCGKSMIELVYGDASAPTEPTAVRCKNPKLRGQCRFGQKPLTADTRAALLPRKLVDDDAGALASVGVDVGQGGAT